jgi:tetratricopeptide (TPR) repeat protein
VLHLLSALLLLKILRLLKVPAAWFVAVLFALHPVQVESVAWITELKNTLSGVFFFGAALVYLAFDAERNKRRYAAAFCYAAAIFPAVGFFNVYPFRFSFVADHFQYLAMPAPLACAAAVTGAIARFLRIKNRRAVTLVLFGALLPALAFLTWRQSASYADAETHYRTTIRTNPSCWMAYNNLGICLLETGRGDEAIVHFQKAVMINPSFFDGHYNLADALLRQGRPREALFHLERALTAAKTPQQKAFASSISEKLTKRDQADVSNDTTH